VLGDDDFDAAREGLRGGTSTREELKHRDIEEDAVWRAAGTQQADEADLPGDEEPISDGVRLESRKGEMGAIIEPEELLADLVIDHLA